MNKTTIKVMKSFRLHPESVDKLRRRLDLVLKAKAEAIWENWNDAEGPQRKLPELLYKALVKLVPKDVMAFYKKNPTYTNSRTEVDLLLPPEHLPAPLQNWTNWCGTTVKLAAPVPVATGNSWYRVDTDMLPAGKEHDQIHSILMDYFTAAAETRVDASRIHSLLGGYDGYKRMKHRQKARTLYDLYQAWPVLAEQYCEVDGIVMPTDENSEDLARVVARTATSTALVPTGGVTAMQLAETAKRLGLGYDLPDSKGD